MNIGGWSVGRAGWWVLGVAVVLFWEGVALGQGQQPPHRVEPVVVTATRLEEPLERVGASVSVISEEEIQSKQYRTVEEALRTVPGLDVQRSGGLGKLTSVRIRGAAPTQIQVLIDGARVKSPTTGDFDFSDLTTDNVERIEVVRGPQSTLYGADAIGGVINIITKRGVGKPTASVTAEGGNYETFRERAATSGKYGNLDVSLGVSRSDSQGQFPNDEFGGTSLFGQIGHPLPNNGRLAMVTRYTKAHRGIPFKTVFPAFDPNSEQDDESLVNTLQWTQPFTSIWEHRLSLSSFNSEITFQDPPDPGESGSTLRSQTDVRRLEADWLHHINLGKPDTVTLGFEWREERGNNKGTFDKSITTRALLLQNELRLFDRFFLTGGFRVDDHSTFGTEVTPRVALSYLVKEWGTRFKASWAEGFRAPTLNDLFYPGFPPCPPFGNQNLDPEKSKSFDAGAEQGFWQNRVKLGVTYFQNDFRDMIQFALVDPANYCFQAQNVGRARSRGVEVEASVEPINRLLLTAAYTYTDTRDITAGTELRRFPRNRAVLSALWEATDRIATHATVTVVSSQFEDKVLGRNAGYTRVDLGGYSEILRKWGILENLRLTATINNLLDEDYQETFGFPALGLNYLVGLTARF